MTRARKRRRLSGAGAALLTLLVLGAIAAPAQAANPLFTFTPVPPPPPPGGFPSPPTPPPTGYLNGPCGLSVDSSGRFYIADHYHDRVDVYSPNAAYASPDANGATGYQGQLNRSDSLYGPCGLALDATDNLYVSSYHGGVRKYGAFGSFGSGTAISGVGVDGTHPTGVAVDKSSGDVYVNQRTEIGVYDAAGSQIGQIGTGELGDAHGVAVSGYAGTPSTAGYVYVPDAASNTVKVFESDGTLVDELENPLSKPFVSLRGSSIAIDDASGEVYFTDNTQPTDAEQPEAIVYAYGPDGNWDGYLRDRVVTALPAGLAVDNSGTSTQGRIYVASGNTHLSGIYAYPAGAATIAAPKAPVIPSPPVGGGETDSSISIGDSSNRILCQGDACQPLPSAPADPTLTTLLAGPGNPRVRYRNTSCALIAGTARKLNRQARARSRGARRARDRRRARALRVKAGKLRRLAVRRSRAARRCRREQAGRYARASASASASTAAGSAVSEGSTGTTGDVGSAAAASPAPAAPAGAAAQGLLPGEGGFAAEVRADGEAATQAGSHPYRMSFDVGLDQSAGSADLRSVQLDLPSGLLANPAVVGTCPSSAFSTARSSPFASSESGEDCNQLFQVGTIDVTTGAGGGDARRFGVFQLVPPNGAAARFGAAPFGHHIRFDARLLPGGEDGGLGLSLSAEIPAGLEARSLRLTLWGNPWDESHNTERGDCLNESEPSFGWSRCSVGDALKLPPLAFLTLPTVCGDPLSFGLRARSWQQSGTFTAHAVGRETGGVVAPIDGCGALDFKPNPLGVLSVDKASSPSGFVFRLDNDDPALTDPRTPIRSHPRRGVVELPDGVTINPSLGAGLGACSAAQYAAETLAGDSGCPADSKIGDFLVQTPFYQGTLRGSIFLAKPHDNPFNSLLAIYLVARSAERGILIRLPGKLTPDPGDGTLTATVDDLPQLPYTNLDIVFRTGQRAPLVSPPRCGAARTRITITPWAQGAPSHVSTRDSEIATGIDRGPCPSGTPPFSPEAITGGVNSNVNSYTPYFVHLIRKDTEQELTGYSLVLPEGITGKLAGIPFCPESSIAAARANGGLAEAAAPSCPTSSQVGRTETGYGVGSALTYATGRIFLAGPYKGAPLSLVTVNSATVGPFDLGTIVVRSAFRVDSRTAQLRIDAGVSDPIPHIIDGVPLHLRDVRVYMDRPAFTHNPSSCEPSELISDLGGSGVRFDDPSDDTTARVSKHFQLLNCLTLGFSPKLGLRLKGAARRGGFPALRATFAARGPRDSNLKRIEVNMPRQLFLAQNHIRRVCTRVQFAADSCPAGSIYGSASAYTPLLDQPLRGKVYLRSSSHKLPDLVTSLHSGAIRIDLVGRIGPSRDGGIQAFFDNLPDAPIDRFVMFLRGGRRGLLTNSVNICKLPPRASVKGLAQNNRGAIFTTKLRGQCGKAKKRAKRNKKNKRSGRRGGRR